MRRAERGIANEELVYGRAHDFERIELLTPCSSIRAQARQPRAGFFLVARTRERA
jgi:hypothetical protein